MGTVADLIGSGGEDPEAAERLAEQVENVQKKLTPKAFIDNMFVEPLKDFVKDKVPGAETVMNLFSRLTDDGGSSNSTCPGPAIDIPMD